MKQNTYFVIDFDSTFTKVEAFDVLADISLKGHPDLPKIKKQIEEITNLGMTGDISFRESLEKRLTLLALESLSLMETTIKLRNKYICIGIDEHYINL